MGHPVRVFRSVAPEKLKTASLSGFHQRIELAGCTTKFAKKAGSLMLAGNQSMPELFQEGTGKQSKNLLALPLDAPHSLHGQPYG